MVRESCYRRISKVVSQGLLELQEVERPDEQCPLLRIISHHRSSSFWPIHSNRTMKLALFTTLCTLTHGLEYPDELFDRVEVEAVMESSSSNHLESLGLHFNVPNAFNELNSFLSIQESIQTGTKAHSSISPVDIGRVDFKDEPPILCETICRPVNDTEMSSARAEAGSAEAQVKNVEAANAANAAALQPGGLSFIQMESKICTAKGGGWVDGVEGADGQCEPFMQASEATVKYQPEAIFHTCSSEFGKLYVPCSPYQALALSHLYQVPDKSHYRLWPGGRPDQVTNAAMKQQIGNNPSSGLDTCPDQQHVGFFHNWDESHVDSWGCLHDELYMSVLCCRRGVEEKKKSKKEEKVVVEEN